MQLMQREKGVLIALPKSELADVEQPIHLGGECRLQMDACNCCFLCDLGEEGMRLVNSLQHLAAGCH